MESKLQSMEWKNPMYPVKKVQISTHMGKGMLIVFWDSQGQVLDHY
jgi:hypothetical protein